MDNKCFITKLLGSVDDASIPYLGEIRCSLITNPQGVNPFVINPVDNKSVNVELTGNGYLSVNDQNKGKVVKIDSITKITPIDFDNESYIRIYPKYNLDTFRVTTKDTSVTLNLDMSQLECSPIRTFTYRSLGTDMYLKDVVKLSKVNVLNIRGNIYGDISLLNKLPLNSLLVQSKYIVGSLSDISSLTNLTKLNLEGKNNIGGSLSDISSFTNLTDLNLIRTNVVGSLSDISSLTNLERMSLIDTNVSGDISVCTFMKKADWIELTGTKVTGNINSLKSLTTLTWLQVPTTVTATEADIKHFTDLGCIVVVGDKKYNSTKS